MAPPSPKTPPVVLSEPTAVYVKVPDELAGHVRSIAAIFGELVTLAGGVAATAAAAAAESRAVKATVRKLARPRARRKT